MRVIRVRQGLDVPIAGAPRLEVRAAEAPETVGLVGADTIGLRARVHVEVGESVKRGAPLFEDRRNPGVQFTSPAAGRVVAVNRGERRALLSVVVALNDAERAGEPTPDDFFTFSSWREGHHESLDRHHLKALLLESGLWTALRTRPFSKVAPADRVPEAIFITAVDSHPLAAPIDVVLEGSEPDFELGVRLVSQLTDGTTWLCRAAGSVEGSKLENVEEVVFEGPHPAGTPGLHIHTLHPVGRERAVWHLGAQDVVAVGRLARTGRLPIERIVSIAGPAVKEPRLFHARLGASLADLTRGLLHDGDLRVISGSVLSGREAHDGFLGRYHTQVTCLQEGTTRQFLGWLRPGLNKFSSIPTMLSGLLPKKHFALTTSQNGEHRAMVPVGVYERVMPLDVLPTFLLRALAMDDTEQAEKLGALELDEEDLALCSFVCPGKTDWGAALRKTLDTLEREG